MTAQMVAGNRLKKKHMDVYATRTRLTRFQDGRHPHLSINSFIFFRSDAPSREQISFIIRISSSPTRSLQQRSMNCFIFSKSGFPSSPQHCFIIVMFPRWSLI